MSYSNGLLQSNDHGVLTVKGPRGEPGVSFKQTSSGDFNIDNKILYHVKTQDDVPSDADYETILKDYKSAVNKEYLKNNFLKRDKTGVYFDLRGYSIQNSEVYNPSTWNDKTITNKEYVDLRDNLKADKTELAKKADLETSDEQTFKGILNVPDFDPGYSNMTNVMNKRYIDTNYMTKTMGANLTQIVQDTYLSRKTGGLMENSIRFDPWRPANTRQINNLASPQFSGSATNKAYVDGSVQNKVDVDKAMLPDGTQAMQANLDMGGHKITGMSLPNNDLDVANKKYVDSQISKTVVSANDENAFSYVMEYHNSQLSEESDVELGDVKKYNSSPHQINKNTIEMNLLLDSSKGYYSSRIGINLYPLYNDDYTLCFELMWPSSDVESIFLNGVSSVETVHNVKKKTLLSRKYSRLICQFTKSQNAYNNYLFIDIEIKLNSGVSYPSKFQTYFIIYGVESLQTDVDPGIYDALYFTENGLVYFNEEINMQGNKIVGLGDNTNDDSGAVNLKQLNTAISTLKKDITDSIGTVIKPLQPKSYYNTIFEYFYDLLDPSTFIMADTLGSVVSGLFGNLVFYPTKLLADFDPNKGFIGGILINLNENINESNDWTIYLAFKYEYKTGDNKRIKITFGGSTLDFPWLKIEHNDLTLDYDFDLYSKQIRDVYIGEYLNLWYTKIAGQFRIAVCDNGMSIDQTISGFNINTSKIKIATAYYIQRIGFSKTAYPINDKEYHKVQFLDKAKGVFFE